MTALAQDNPLDDAERDFDRLRSLLTAAEARIAELVQANQALIHERDRLAAQVTQAVRISRREPAITLYCDSPDCTTPALTRDVAPPEDAIPLWVRGLGWECTEGGYVCPRCSRAR